MRLLSLLAGCLLLLSSCEVKINTGSDVPEEVASGSKIRNGINVKPSGVTVKQAFLTYDDGSLVGEENKTSVNRKLKLNLVVNGWKAAQDKVFLEANEKVVTSDGEVVLDETDLFSKSGVQGVSSEDAQYPKLSVVINNVSKLYDYYQVNFRIWNKAAQDQYIDGSYKFNIQ